MEIGVVTSFGEEGFVRSEVVVKKWNVAVRRASQWEWEQRVCPCLIPAATETI